MNYLKKVHHGRRRLEGERERRKSTRPPSGAGGLDAFDYPWDPAGFKSTLWKKALKSAGKTGLFAVLLVPFNYWAFKAGAPWPIKAVVFLSDLILSSFLWEAGLKMADAFHAGNSKVVFEKFPYRAGSAIALRWCPPKAAACAGPGHFTLRCVEEWIDRQGRGKRRASFLIHEELWSETWLFEKDGFAADKEVALSFEPPSGLPSTRLCSDKPVFWELEVELKVRGKQLKETYLIPVYAPA